MNLGHYFMGDCARCKRHTRVYESRLVDREELKAAGGRIKEADEPVRARCAFCIWKMVSRFAFKMWTPEDSKCYVEHAPLFGPDGKLIHAL